MRFRSLGATGLSVSVLGFGASPLGSVFGKTLPSGDSALINRAVEKGINFFDVSPYYGLGEAEDRLGAALLPHRRDIVLATKCGRYGTEEFDFTASGITNRLEESLRRLRTDAVDLLQLHDVEFGDFQQMTEEAIPTLIDLQQQGKTRFIGITGYWPDLLARIMHAARVDTVLNYCHWNLFANDMDRHLTPAAAKAKVALINASPLHMGLLSGAVKAEWHPAPTTVVEAANQVIATCRRRGINPATLAVWRCLTHPSVATTLIGLADIPQVDASCAALEFHPDDDLLEEVRQVVSPIFNTTWPQGTQPNRDQHIEELSFPS